jgi:homoserine dehydrogenase
MPEIASEATRRNSYVPLVERVRVGLLGCGNVGGALVAILARDADAIATRTGVRLEITRIAVRSTVKERSVAIDPALLTHDPAEVVADPDVDVVVEVMGGIEPARALILDALKAGKPVVTANKELVANVGQELFEAASTAGVDLLFEAAVGGGIPLIRPLRESLAGERITRVTGIVNGTTNFILTRMAEEGADYRAALAEAQQLGYAERDPTADVEGYDAGAKAAILATIAFGARVVAGDVYREGISGVTAADIAYAARLGYVVKLVAVAELSDEGAVGVRVHPAMVPTTHPLASVRDSFNAVFIEGEAVGELMLYGRGAGGMPTASAVLGDLIDAAHNLRSGGVGRTPLPSPAVLRSIDDLTSAYYLDLEVLDRPGVLARVAGVMGDHGVSIRSMEQEGTGDGARIVFITHTALERDIQSCLTELRSLDVVAKVGTLLRVLGS